ncbi:hypothetical protein DFH07DRAFT_768257 [Mycena maculata]|uniref:Uncharacterized protein n=1 Tax=Mycena maculata TaxID=230809 RepID=A0AAD7NQU8_9AGAR|nr:hypothetical protein DFH07DRAFT_768257 [Mycena maculata]
MPIARPWSGDTSSRALESGPSRPTRRRRQRVAHQSRPTDAHRVTLERGHLVKSAGKRSDSAHPTTTTTCGAPKQAHGCPSRDLGAGTLRQERWKAVRLGPPDDDNNAHGCPSRDLGAGTPRQERWKAVRLGPPDDDNNVWRTKAGPRMPIARPWSGDTSSRALESGPTRPTRRRRQRMAHQSRPRMPIATLERGHLVKSAGKRSDSAHPTQRRMDPSTVPSPPTRFTKVPWT